MLYHALAALVLVAHLAFIVFVVVGGLLALRWHWAPLVHLPAALWGVFIELSGGICPLTPLENYLLRAGGASGYSGGFIEHHLVPIIYPVGLSPSIQVLLAALVVFVNALVYSLIWRRIRASRRIDT